MSAHLDLDGLCDLLAGEGGPAQVDHVAVCPHCSSALADLEQAQEPVRALLAALPDPPVPADLGARLDAALLQAREQDLAAAVPGRGGLTVVRGSDDPPARAGSLAVTRSARGPSWLLGSAAAVVTVAAVAGIGLGISRVGGGGSSDSSVSSTASSAGSSAGTAAGSAPLSAAAPRTAVPASSTGTDYAAGQAALAAALPALLRGGAGRAPAASADPLARLHTSSGLAGCLAGLAEPGGDTEPVALDYARYAGAPALVVVLPGRTTDRVDVFVVGADCRAGAADTLLFAELSRS